MTILWWTDVTGNSTVEYGTTAGARVVGHRRRRPRAARSERAGTCHTVPLTGLTPGTRYYYRLLTNGTAGARDDVLPDLQGDRRSRASSTSPSSATGARASSAQGQIGNNHECRRSAAARDGRRQRLHRTAPSPTGTTTSSSRSTRTRILRRARLHADARQPRPRTTSATPTGRTRSRSRCTRCRGTRPPARRSATSRSTTATPTSSCSTPNPPGVNGTQTAWARGRPRRDHAQVEVRLPAPHAVLVRERLRVDRQRSQRPRHLGPDLRAVRRRHRLRSATITATSARTLVNDYGTGGPRHDHVLHHDRRRRRDARRRRAGRRRRSVRIGLHALEGILSLARDQLCERRERHLLQLLEVPAHRGPHRQRLGAHAEGDRQQRRGLRHLRDQQGQHLRQRLRSRQASSAIRARRTARRRRAARRRVSTSRSVPRAAPPAACATSSRPAPVRPVRVRRTASNRRPRCVAPRPAAAIRPRTAPARARLVPPSTISGNGTVCRAAAGVCDLDETCNG